MFGFQGGENADTVARKRGYMQDAQQRWGFMTNFDLLTIKNEVQLSSMVKDRHLGGTGQERRSGLDARQAVLSNSWLRPPRAPSAPAFRIDPSLIWTAAIEPYPAAIAAV